MTAHPDDARPGARRLRRSPPPWGQHWDGAPPPRGGERDMVPRRSQPRAAVRRNESPAAGRHRGSGVGMIRGSWAAPEFSRAHVSNARTRWSWSWSWSCAARGSHAPARPRFGGRSALPRAGRGWSWSERVDRRRILPLKWIARWMIRIRVSTSNCDPRLFAARLARGSAPDSGRMTRRSHGSARPKCRRPDGSSSWQGCVRVALRLADDEAQTAAARSRG